MSGPSVKYDILFVRQPLLAFRSAPAVSHNGRVLTREAPKISIAVPAFTRFMVRRRAFHRTPANICRAIQSGMLQQTIQRDIPRQGRRSARSLYTLIGVKGQESTQTGRRLQGLRAIRFRNIPILFSRSPCR